jgi:exopolysaccharide production protein ExoZ
MLLNVQMLRAVAAFLVVFVHLARLGQLAGLPADATYFGNSGVDLFFVVSGMIMVMTTAGGRQTSLWFLRNRVARIVPLYWAITLAVFAVALVAPSLLQSTTADPVQLVESLLFIPFPRANGVMHPTVFVGWSLNYEMIFYVLFAMGMALPRRAGLALTCGLLALAVAAGLAFRPSDPVLKFYFQPVVLEFAAGMILGALLPRLPAARGWRWPAAFLGLAAFVVMLLGPLLMPGADRAVMFGIAAVVIVACAVIAERAGLRAGQGWIQLLGAASYAIYLTHFFCTQVVVKAAERLAGLGPLAMWALFPVAFLLVAVVGVLAHRTLELPLTELARRCFAPARAPRRESMASRAA